LRDNTTGTSNTAVGRQTLASTTTGACNTAVGTLSLFNNTTGVRNTALGFNAGRCITTGACNVIIGSANAVGFETQNNNIILSDGAGNIRMFVTGSTGFVGAGPGFTAPLYPLHVSGSFGGISIYATNDIAAFSDESVKTDLQIIDNALDKVREINGYTYVRSDSEDNLRRAGVVAQEVQKVLPEVITKNQDGTLNVAYPNLVALLIEAIKELDKEVKELKSKQ
jgi:hypothetical protein